MLLLTKSAMAEKKEDLLGHAGGLACTLHVKWPILLNIVGNAAGAEQQGSGRSHGEDARRGGGPLQLAGDVRTVAA